MPMVNLGSVAINTDHIATVNQVQGYSYSQVCINLTNGKEVWVSDMSHREVVERVNAAIGKQSV